MTPALPALWVCLPSHPPGRLVLQVKPFPSSLSHPLEQIVEKERRERERERKEKEASLTFCPPSLPIATANLFDRSSGGHPSLPNQSSLNASCCLPYLLTSLPFYLSSLASLCSVKVGCTGPDPKTKDESVEPRQSKSSGKRGAYSYILLAFFTLSSPDAL